MTTTDPANTVLQFLRAIEHGAPAEELETFLHPEVRQREHPSLVQPFVAERGLADILTGSVRGRELLSRQEYDVHDVVVSGERVVLQLLWTGVLAVGLGDLPAGHRLRAHVAMFVTVRGGRIVHQASYDCYEPLDPAADDDTATRRPVRSLATASASVGSRS